MSRPFTCFRTQNKVTLGDYNYRSALLDLAIERLQLIGGGKFDVNCIWFTNEVHFHFEFVLSIKNKTSEIDTQKAHLSHA